MTDQSPLKVGSSFDKRGYYAYAVFDGDTQVSGSFSHRELAEARADDIAKAARSKQRSCLRCNVTFLSEGVHNRMCDPCRRVTIGAEFTYG